MKYLTLILVILAISLTFVSAYEDSLEYDTPALEDEHLLEDDQEQTLDHEENTESEEPTQERKLEADERAALEKQENTEATRALEETNVLEGGVAAEPFPNTFAAEPAAVPVAETTVPSVIKVLLVIFGSIGGFFMFMLPMGVIVTFLSTLVVAYQKKKISEHQNKQNSIKATIENVAVDYTSLDEKVVPGASN